MTFIEALIGGILQGVTEFLPVSSSGHLALLHGIFGMSDPGEYALFDIMLHLATLCAVFFIYGKEIVSLIPAFFKMIGKLFSGRAKELLPKERFALYLVISTVPLAGALIIADTAEKVSGSVRLVGLILIFNGLLLLLGDIVGKRNKDISSLGIGGAISVGLFQFAAILPGLSRSGSTITGGLFCGLTREEAVKYSFILSVPAIIGANLAGAAGIVGDAVPKGELPVYTVGMIAAAITGFLSLKLIGRIAKKRNFGIFAYYCFAVGLAAVIFG